MTNFTIHNPHDSFFKHILSNLTVAKDFLQAHLSPSITQRIQWDSLRLSNKSYTDDKLAQLHSDVVYTCQLDEKGPSIYILLEQQSTPDPLLPFRFLQYNVALLAEHLAQNKKGNQKTKLPIILNLCLYSGKKTPYPYAADIQDCFEDPILAKSEWCKPLSLIDLGQMSEAALQKHGTAHLMELLLKQSRERTFLNWIQEHPALVVRMTDALFDLYGISSIVFILGVESKHSAKEILDALGNIVPHKKETIMTAAQQLKQRGIQESMHAEKLHIATEMLSELHLDMQTIAQQLGKKHEQKGRQQERLHIAKKMLDAHESKEKVHQFTGLSRVEIEELV